ncbi:MAG: hypothetical protein A2731_02440 [Candidatus Buchananbacteria bacterium RIFCSPHIGHO2_01_FULL_39_8]|uniref:Zinc finger DksA/TraR C4-type domain-containing protein n=1 Tax=Candidatus Buchananbacteria bacterium RIFCSPHIGHO2_01_FULL_39_8 TaxID=1797533 RepID=A0A1G1XV54_9BACT|nr:MAG: hypothetical protein A2731_02440 [Candidatus Buchananbacteria bacterium RIFCSPHIGHO2_01_FULL_39_8]
MGDLVDRVNLQVETETHMQSMVSVSRHQAEKVRAELAADFKRRGWDGRSCLAGCGQKIPEARLKAVPNALLCIKCQGKVEQEAYASPHRSTVAALVFGQHMAELRVAC